MAGTAALPWPLLSRMVRQLQRDPASATSRSEAQGGPGEWPPELQLLALIANSVRTLVWAKTEDAHRLIPKNRPEPIVPPGVASPVSRTTKTFGTARMTLVEAQKWLARRIKGEG